MPIARRHAPARVQWALMHAFFSRFGWQVLGVLCLAGAVALGVAVHTYHILPMDTAIYDWVHAHMINPGLTPVVRAFTQLASAVGLIIIAMVLLIVLAVRHHARIGVAIALNLAVEAALNEVIKAIVQRPRPSVEHLVVERGFSFPSGHAMAATAFYGFLIYLLYHYRRHTAAVWALIVALGAIVPVTMFTRVYLGVHYASDVLAGFLFSIAYLTLLSVPVLQRTLLRPQGVGAEGVVV